MRNKQRTKVIPACLICLFGALVIVGMAAAAPHSPQVSNEVTHFGGANWTGWPADSEWVRFTTLNDPDDSIAREQVDLVGDSSYPGVYIYSNSDYLFFRVRVDYDGDIQVGSPFSDAVFVLIDVVGAGTAGYPDYAIAWDSSSPLPCSHGEEMKVPPGSPGATWGAYGMDDLDGSNIAKVSCHGGTDCTSFACDFSCSDCGSGFEGYVRTIDEVSTTSFGNTAFIDFAAKWDYLENETALRAAGQNWKIAVGTAAGPYSSCGGFGQCDHQPINTDVGSGSRGCGTGSNVTASECWSNELDPGNPTAVALTSFTATTIGDGVRSAWEAISEALALIRTEICNRFGRFPKCTS